MWFFAQRERCFSALSATPGAAFILQGDFLWSLDFQGVSSFPAILVVLPCLFGGSPTPMCFFVKELFHANIEISSNAHQKKKQET